ncbi:hypothetical protein B9G69_000330 [Bdellovibrio sp. SKB1291214]|uniref:hypothetical protein n=1 Tax=Bdellovibrio sp. SKB1291214 TaxID=1732569 RepID=UPI000B51DF25|nr:hypothetical protein [Bdellovibrio sp. SKB1291214]UYL09020.1 hypothetical protein B9G69_000330 [Bdellovibrio sp. SKB1291214]
MAVKKRTEPVRYKVTLKTKERFAIPEMLIPADFANALKSFFSDELIVRKAAYVLVERNHEFSYLVAVDLKVYPDEASEQLANLKKRLWQFVKIQYQGKWPLDFGVWSDGVIDFAVSKKPELLLYSKK